MSEIEVVDNAEEQRFEARLDRVVAGFAAYRLAPGRIVFTHTEVFPRFEGHGVGGALARRALDAVRERGDVRVVPLCPFIKAWIEKHPDYADLVAGAS